MNRRIPYSIPIALAVIMALATLITLGCSHQNGPPVTAPRQNTDLAREQNAAAYKLIAEGKYNEAEIILRHALSADVMYGPARNNLALVYFHEGKLYDASWELDWAIRLMPHTPAVRNNLGKVLEAGGKLNEATDAYVRAVEMEPDNPEFIGNLAVVRWKRHLYDEETRKLLQQIVFKDNRPDWVRWAKDMLVHVPPPGQDIILLPTTRPGT
jgi:Tfp pilus assembly protein PilF